MRLLILLSFSTIYVGLYSDFVDLQEQHQKEKTRVLQAQKLLNEAEAAKNVTVEDLTRGIVNYKYLGLVFEKAENERLR